MEVVEHKTVSIYDLIHHGRNYNKHPQEQIEKVKASLRRFGQVDDAIVKRMPDSKYKIVAHECVTTSALQLLEAGECLHLERWNITIVPQDWTDLDVEGYMVASNETARLSIPDEGELASLLQEQQDAGYDLASLGSDDESLRQLLESLGNHYLDNDSSEDEEDEDLLDISKESQAVETISKLRFGKYEVPLTQDEFKDLERKLKRYSDDMGSYHGFVRTLL